MSEESMETQMIMVNRHKDDHLWPSVYCNVCGQKASVIWMGAWICLACLEQGAAMLKKAVLKDVIE